MNPSGKSSLWLVVEVALMLAIEFAPHWQQQALVREDIRYRPEKNYNTLLLEGRELLNAFVQELREYAGSILGIEKPFSFTLEGLPIPIIGVCDLILEDPHGTITIVDHKTTLRAYSKTQIDNSLQLTVYHLGAKLNGMAQRDILLRLDCLIKTKRPKFEQYYTVRTQKHELRVKRLIQEVYKGISAGVFTPNINSWKCASCEYQGACEVFFQEEK